MSSKSVGPPKSDQHRKRSKTTGNNSSRTQSERGRTTTRHQPPKCKQQQMAKKYPHSAASTPTQQLAPLGIPQIAPDSERMARKVYYPDQNCTPLLGDHFGVVLCCNDDLVLLSTTMMQHHHPHPTTRSQSFRHRPARPMAPEAVAARHRTSGGTTDSSTERRRSTPTITRRCSLQGRSRVEPRIDAWPEPKQMSEVVERFLQLPDSGDYTRVRQFNIDAKGAVISRGDSFRRKRQTAGTPTSVETQPNTQLTQNGDTSPLALSSVARPLQASCESRSASVSSASGGGAATTKLSSTLSVLMNGSSGDDAQAPPHSARSAPASVPEPASTSAYRICVLGQTGSGKSALIRQFISSDYRNAFADELGEDVPSAVNPTVSINIGGHECDLSFTECDPQTTPDWLGPEFHAFLLVYSIDRKASFRVALRALEELRAEHCPAPVILVGNKMDLERRRTVMEHEVKSVMLTHDVAHFQVSVALNHDVDDLLIGIIAQIKEAFRMGMAPAEANARSRGGSRDAAASESDFQAAIRRFSRRKKRQMGLGAEGDGAETRGRCTNLMDKLRRWRKGNSTNF